jgi:hypothetical protein
MFVYVIVCSETQKIYIGQHKRDDLRHYLQQKWYEAHNNVKRRSHLYAAMRRHSRETWSIHSLVSGIETRAEVDALEKHFIRALNTQHPEVGYNICAGGEGLAGEFTPEHRAKLRAAIANRDPAAEAERRKQISEKMSVIMLGNTHYRGNIKSLCKYGHPITEQYGKRFCLTCSRIQSRDWYRARKA